MGVIKRFDELEMLFKNISFHCIKSIPTRLLHKRTEIYDD